MTTKTDIEKALADMDAGSKTVFLNLSREEQLLIIFSMETSNSNRLALVERRQLDFEVDIKDYRRKRESREDMKDNDVMNTTQKMMKIIADAKAKEFNTWVYFRDRILPNLLSPAILILLYLIFTQMKP